MNDAFEDAFYQLDEDRDGVVTVADLQRYVEKNHLKDRFIQKWLTLFGDERNIIYYQKFCETLGIVPALDKFEQITYKIDMTETTKHLIFDMINKYRDKDENLEEDTFEIIKKKLGQSLGDKWHIKMNPTAIELNTEYGPDGLLYYSPHKSGEQKLLIYREIPEPSKGFTGTIYKEDMTEKTKESIQKIISDRNPSDEDLSSKNVNEIIREIEVKHQDKWGMILNPTPQEREAPYGLDGMLYYSLDDTGNPKILVWRKPAIVKKENKDLILESIMSDSVKEDVLNIFHRNYNPKLQKLPKSERIIKELNDKHGMAWNVVVNPSAKELIVDYDFDGKIYFIPKSNEEMKILIWRQDKEKVRGNVCCCCC